MRLDRHLDVALATIEIPNQAFELVLIVRVQSGPDLNINGCQGGRPEQQSG